MKTIIFGGLGTIANTSYLQRKAFNDAFEQLSVEWHWGEEEYRDLLIQPGSEERIERYNTLHGGLPNGVTPAQVNKLKTDLFHASMKNTKLSLRPGAEWVIEQAKSNKTKLAFATTTSRENIEILLQAARLEQSTFDIITDRSLVKNSKPDPEVYQYCLAKLNVLAADCLAIEDSVSGVEAAVGAGLKCVAFPNEFTAGHDYSDAAENVDDLEKSSILVD